jgi:1-deoxy-D-xylulose-5-phosphate synthase
MERDEKVVACTAAMPDGTGLAKVMPKFPDRTWDTGICESHAMDMMAGIAKTGWKPFFAVYSTFVQRAFDQAFQEVALQGLPVRICLDRAGLVGGDGAVHHGFCDISHPPRLPRRRAARPDGRAVSQGGARVHAHVRRRPLRRALPARQRERPVHGSQDCPPFELGKARALLTHESRTPPSSRTARA